MMQQIMSTLTVLALTGVDPPQVPMRIESVPGSVVVEMDVSSLSPAALGEFRTALPAAWEQRTSESGNDLFVGGAVVLNLSVVFVLLTAAEDWQRVPDGTDAPADERLRLYQVGDPVTVEMLAILPVGSVIEDTSGLVQSRWVKAPTGNWNTEGGGAIADPDRYVPHYRPVLVSTPGAADTTTKEN